MVIVIVTRNDLRDEFAMADEAFALSPISARPAQPSEADYDAIREAFMETSRGRWFLGEYAKRNRNADTKMVLDAVARIEETLAAQKKPDRDPALDAALAAIRSGLDEARTAASAAIKGLALAENLAPVRKGARVVREISWRLREIGADGRICDLIDSQLSAIEGASARIADIDPADALSSAFDLIEGRLAVYEASDEADAASAAQATHTSSAAFGEDATASAAADEEAPASPIQADRTESPKMTVAPEETARTAGAAKTAIIDARMIGEPVEVTVEATGAIGEPADIFDEQDEALLNMVAAEMAAPDSDEAYVPPEFRPSDAGLPDNEALELEPAQPSDIGERAEPAAIPAAPFAAERPASPSPEISLGSSLLANGIVPKPRISKPDPLAPIRRMSQTEKIAFFS